MHRIVFAGGFLIVQLTASLGAQSFSAVVTTPWANPQVGYASALAVAMVDVTGDGHGDVVVVDRTFGRIQTLVGDGAGGLVIAATSIPGFGLFSEPYGVGDLNADGRVDLLLGGLGVSGSGVSANLGDGAGGFVPTAAIPGMPAACHMMNLNGDDRPDVVGFGFGGILTIALGAPGGGFAPAAVVSAPVPLPVFGRTFVSGDVDGDGNDDLLVGGVPSSVALFGDGLGGFRAGQTLLPSTIPSALADLDGDGDLDLLANDSAGVVRLFPNDGQGAFPAASLVLAGAPGSTFLRQVAAADLDGDGHSDFLIATGSTIQVRLADGAGAFGAAQSYVVGALDAFVVGDLDADGNPDVVAAGGGAVHFLRGVGAPSAGLAGYGLGTPTCRGTLGITGTRTPRVGAVDFRVQCTNVPGDSTGLLLFGSQVVGGWDPFDLDLRLHLGFLFPLGTMHSGSAGVASLSLPLPGSPWLVGFRVHLQSVWMAEPGLGDTCSPARHELASSRGLTITLQP